MLLAIIVICIALIFLLDHICLDELILIPGYGIIISVLVACLCLFGVSRENVIDDKIAMYQEENAVIESQIELLVKNYMEYESDIFENCTAETTITLIDMYPELKSDSLVSKQLDVYLKNNDKIKQLKEDKIDIGTCKWWLYFGGGK